MNLRSPVTLHPPVGSEDHILNFGSQNVTLVEYGDYQCTHCKAFYKEFEKLVKTQVTFQFCFRHFPLRLQHPFAQLAAQAAEAASIQNKFWEMHDALFSYTKQLDYDTMNNLAQHINLDIKRFVTDMKRTQVHQKIQQDFESGVRSGVNGTPSLFINGHRYDGPKTAAQIIKMLQL